MKPIKKPQRMSPQEIAEHDERLRFLNQVLAMVGITINLKDLDLLLRTIQLAEKKGKAFSLQDVDIIKQDGETFIAIFTGQLKVQATEVKEPISELGPTDSKLNRLINILNELKTKEVPFDEIELSVTDFFEIRKELPVHDESNDTMRINDAKVSISKNLELGTVRVIKGKKRTHIEL